MYSLKYLPYVQVVAVMAALQAFPAQAEGSLPEIQQQGDISYVSGGIGRDESTALEAVQNNYNLRILSADKTGHFFGDTRIVVSDLQHQPLLDITGGPFFYVNLPNGRYIVEGFNEGQSKKQNVTIANGKSARVHFSWQQNFADAATR